MIVQIDLTLKEGPSDLVYRPYEFKGDDCEIKAHVQLIEWSFRTPPKASVDVTIRYHNGIVQKGVYIMMTDSRDVSKMNLTTWAEARVLACKGSRVHRETYSV